MKRLSLAIPITLCFLAGLSSPVQAQRDPLYFAGYMGFHVFPDRSFGKTALSVANAPMLEDDNLHFGGALGFRLNSQIRIEAGVNYNQTTLGSLQAGKPLSGRALDILTLMFNGYYDFNLDRTLQPYVSAGAGIGFFDADILNGRAGFTQNSAGKEAGFVYQVGGGLKYQFGDDLFMTGQYRYFGSEEIDYDRTRLHYSAHEFRLGLEFDLPVGWDITQ